MFRVGKVVKCGFKGGKACFVKFLELTGLYIMVFRLDKPVKKSFQDRQACIVWFFV